MAAAKEAFLSIPNVAWFSIGIAAEVFFLGFGVTPMGMNFGAQVAAAFGMTEGFNAVASVVPPGGGAPVETLDFGIG